MIFNMVGGAGGGKDGAATLTVQAPINTDVTISKDTKSYTKNSGITGIVTFQGLTTGEWTVSISNELQTQTRTVTITTTYSVVIAFFASTINITYPAGSICTVKKDSITLTAPDTSGTWDCVVPSVGVWNVYCTDGELTVDQDVTITSDGETKSLNLAYFTATIAVTYPAGSTCSTTMGDITLNAPDTSGTWNCIVHYAGDWVFTCTDGSQSTTNTVTISTDGESKSLTLSYTLYLYSNGVLNSSYTTNAKTVTSNYIGFTLDQSTADFQNSCLTFSPKVDVTNYKTLIVDISFPVSYSAWGYFGLTSYSQWIDNGTDFVAKVGLRYGSGSFPVTTYTLDISNQTGEYYLKGSTYNAGLLLYGLKLEP